MQGKYYRTSTRTAAPGAKDVVCKIQDVEEGGVRLACTRAAISARLGSPDPKRCRLRHHVSALPLDAGTDLRKAEETGRYSRYNGVAIGEDLMTSVGA